MNNQNKPSFNEYSALFRSEELPLTIHSELHFDFHVQFPALPMDMIDPFIIELNQMDHDDLTEYIPLFRLRPHEDILGLVLWKAALLSYEYYLLTYDLRGSLVDKKIIAGQTTNGEKILLRVATIESDTSILMIQGESSLSRSQQVEYTEEYNFEITPSGYIATL